MREVTTFSPHAHVMGTLTAHEIERLKIFAEMLTYRRPGGTKTEEEFIDAYLTNLPGLYRDQEGNCITVVGDPTPSIMWSSHTDTVHNSDGRQKVVFDPDTNMLKLSANTSSNCLGADCTTGVWLMREMILAGVPGLYVFHAFEECGAYGSSHIASNTPELVQSIKCAIAFDRKGGDEVITHQGGSRCASDAFAKSLGALLPGFYAPSDTGLFTDTANYTHLIPECTNIGVGYYSAHTSKEMQCVPTAVALWRRLTRLTDMDLASLVIQREPVDDRWDDRWDDTRSFDQKYGAWSSWDEVQDYKPKGSWRRSRGSERHTLVELIEDYPEDIAYLLEQYGITVQDVEDFLGM